MELDLLTQTALECRRVAVGRLPEPGDSGADAQQLLLLPVGEVLLELRARDGTRPDHGQVAPEYVQELRHLVHGALADDAAHYGDARVVVDLSLHLPLAELRRAKVLFHVAGVGDHATELKHADHPSAPAHALLRVDRTARGLEADCGADRRHWKGQQDDARAAEDYVERSLAYAVEEGPGRFPRHGLTPRRGKRRECL